MVTFTELNFIQYKEFLDDYNALVIKYKPENLRIKYKIEQMFVNFKEYDMF